MTDRITVVNCRLGVTLKVTQTLFKGFGLRLIGLDLGLLLLDSLTLRLSLIGVILSPCGVTVRGRKLRQVGVVSLLVLVYLEISLELLSLRAEILDRLVDAIEAFLLTVQQGVVVVLGLLDTRSVGLDITKAGSDTATVTGHSLLGLIPSTLELFDLLSVSGALGLVASLLGGVAGILSRLSGLTAARSGLLCGGGTLLEPLVHSVTHRLVGRDSLGLDIPVALSDDVTKWVRLSLGGTHHPLFIGLGDLTVHTSATKGLSVRGNSVDVALELVK